LRANGGKRLWLSMKCLVRPRALFVVDGLEIGVGLSGFCFSALGDGGESGVHKPRDAISPHLNLSS
jgi:hypothetical protein